MSSDLDLISDNLAYEGSDEDDELSGDVDDEALLGGTANLVKSDDMTLKEAQDAIRELLTYVRDGRLKAGVATMQVTAPTAQGAQLVHVDTPESAAARLKASGKSEFEAAIDDLEDLQDDVMGDEDEDEEEIEEIPLKFNRRDHDHNIHAWKKGDDVNVSMRVLRADGKPRVITATTSHEAEMAKIIECFKKLGYTPDKILRLPLKDLASRLGASALVAPTAKHAGAILGAAGDNAPCVLGLC